MDRDNKVDIGVCASVGFLQLPLYTSNAMMAYLFPIHNNNSCPMGLTCASFLVMIFLETY